jgi:outer membrane receptor protein involved in Fe transport
VFVPAVLLALSLGSPVTGTVLDPSGRPIPRAAIVVTAPGGAAVGVVFSDVDGNFRIPDAPDGCRLRTSLSGFAPATADCRSDGPVTLTMALSPVSESVVVSATRTDAPASQVASAVTVFDAEEIERRQQPQLADLLRLAPGTQVVRSGAPGSVTSLFVRGGESNYTKVLLDGIPLNEPGGVFNLGNLTTENLDRVELVRGANSAVYGSDAMTGVLQLFTRRGTSARPDGHATIEGGSFATGRGSAGVAGKSGRFDYSADTAGYTTDNEVPNNAFRNFTLSGTAGAAVNDSATLRFVGRLERGRRVCPGRPRSAVPTWTPTRSGTTGHGERRSIRRSGRGASTHRMGSPSRIRCRRT